MRVKKNRVHIYIQQKAQPPTSLVMAHCTTLRPIAVLVLANNVHVSIHCTTVLPIAWLVVAHNVHF